VCADFTACTKLKFDLPMLFNAGSTRKMTYYYRNRSKFTYNNENHNLVGALILFGGLILVVGMLILEYEIMVFGSGLMILGSLGGVCCLNQTYQANQYEVEDNQLERGELDVDSE
jgi:hypothetical protein